MRDGTVIPRPNLVQIAAHRETALLGFADALQKLGEVNAALNAAYQALRLAAPTGETKFLHGLDHEDRAFLTSLKLPDPVAYSANARKLIDSTIWSYLVTAGDLERVMDATAKAELNKQLFTDPPEATVDTMSATLESLAAQSGSIFRRGIATAFSKLDKRFRSHDGWSIGNRIIISRAFDEYGCWNSYGRTRDTIIDVERVFLVLDGKAPTPSYGGLVGKIDAGRRKGLQTSQFEVETDYIRARTFHNGNIHLWFLRPDLVVRVNQMIGEFYGNPIPEERAPDFTAEILRPKTGIAKNYGFYPTPLEAADRLIGEINFWRRSAEPLLVLEPSAGTGNLASLAADKGAVVDCVEYQADLAEGLRASGRYRNVITGDFLGVTPDPIYDAVVMNPPFDYERDIDHVLHALAFLKPGGQLAAIMSAGTEYRTTKKSEAFRAIVEKHGGRFSSLPEGSFASSGTNVNTVILKLTKRA
jgi:hypothetical protein